jgi:hypothetical protein
MGTKHEKVIKKKVQKGKSEGKNLWHCSCIDFINNYGHMQCYKEMDLVIVFLANSTLIMLLSEMLKKFQILFLSNQKNIVKKIVNI